jgi:drug/metabolite transporter (DMT)-like permease
VSAGLRKTSNGLAYLLLAIAPLTWSGNFIAGRLIRDSLTPLEMSFLRWVIALLILAPFTISAVWRQRAVIARSWKFLFLLGATGIGTFHLLVYVALRDTTAINAGLMMSLTPVIIVMFSYLLFQERISQLQTLGIIISLMGVVVLLARGDIRELTHLQFNKGDLWMLAAVPLWSFYSALLRRTPREVQPLVMVTVIMVAGIAVLTPFMAFRLATVGLSPLTITNTGAVLYVAVFCSVIAYLCWNKGIAMVGANRGGLFMHLTPLFSALLGMLILNEQLRVFHLTGAILVFTGIYLTTSRA